MKGKVEKATCKCFYDWHGPCNPTRSMDRPGPADLSHSIAYIFYYSTRTHNRTIEEIKQELHHASSISTTYIASSQKLNPNVRACVPLHKTAHRLSNKQIKKHQASDPSYYHQKDHSILSWRAFKQLKMYSYFAVLRLILYPAGCPQTI
jgi:hypothetical protein